MKYVCDIETVNSIGQEVVNAAGELNTSITNYSSKITSDLSGWNGSAKDSFTTANNSQVESAKADSEYVEKLGNFIIKAAQEISKIEEQLAGMTI